jgi:hypothetical protein
MNKEIENLQLLGQIKLMIEESRQHAVVAVNSTITALYWHVGNTINRDIMQNSRADYAKQIVATLSRQLILEYGKGWGEKQLRQCMQFTESFPDEQIVYALRIQLSTYTPLLFFLNYFKFK